MPNVLSLPVENAAELLNSGAYGAGAVIRIQSSTTEGGSYANLSGTGATTTVALVSGTSIYTGYDPNGTSSTWYRTRYESADAGRTSDWSTSFQAGDETAGLICSLYDVKQRLFPTGTTSTAEDENILEFIRQAGDWIEHYCRRWFVARPLSGTATYRFHTEAGRVLWIPKGIRSITTLGIATEDQPSSGGTYTTATSTDYYIDPPEADRSPGAPGTRVVFRRNPTGSVTQFSSASFGAEIVGTFGWSAVPRPVQMVGANLAGAIFRARGAAGGGESVTINVDGSRTFERFLTWSDRFILDGYRLPMVA